MTFFYLFGLLESSYLWFSECIVLVGTLGVIILAMFIYNPTAICLIELLRLRLVAVMPLILVICLSLIIYLSLEKALRRLGRSIVQSSLSLTTGYTLVIIQGIPSEF